MLVLSADPWAPDYGMGYQAVADETAVAASDAFVETTDWTAPIRPEGPARHPVTFIDGVRRIELRVVADQDGTRVPGLFGSYAVGAVRCDGAATFDEHRACRSVILCCGMMPERAELDIGASTLTFEPATDPGSDPNRPLVRLQDLMRQEEAALASRLLLRGAGLILVDGPLRLTEPGSDPVVGVIKRFVRRYLEPVQEALLGRLGPGERTPLFGLLDAGAELRGYSWYARHRLDPAAVARPRRAGAVRGPGRGRAGRAVELAERVSALLPRYAGRPSDPRTPQNLAPVARRWRAGSATGWATADRSGGRCLVRLAGAARRVEVTRGRGQRTGRDGAGDRGLDAADLLGRGRPGRLPPARRRGDRRHRGPRQGPSGSPGSSRTSRARHEGA